ncbi:MAG: hypothetical protein VX628_03670 [Cyanobacteriota bacterium]|nr:hypothetical protein [Cyanobacteriota bacterium]MEC7896744.1 hypothetical protein [Cyanobacteriota bacterium]
MQDWITAHGRSRLHRDGGCRDPNRPHPDVSHGNLTTERQRPLDPIHGRRG